MMSLALPVHGFKTEKKMMEFSKVGEYMIIAS